MTEQKTYRIGPQLEAVAAAYCGGNRDPLLYRHAIVIAQCDILISRLRAQAIRYADFAARRQLFSSAKRKSDAPLWLEKQNQIGKSVRHEESNFDAYVTALPYLDRLARLEQRIWLRRKRALRWFLANQNSLSSAHETIGIGMAQPSG